MRNSIGSLARNLALQQLARPPSGQYEICITYGRIIGKCILMKCELDHASSMYGTARMGHSPLAGAERTLVRPEVWPQPDTPPPGTAALAEAMSTWQPCRRTLVRTVCPYYLALTES